VRGDKRQRQINEVTWNTASGMRRYWMVPMMQALWPQEKQENPLKHSVFYESK